MTDGEKKRLYLQLGDRVSDRRREASFSQEELAERVGLSRSSIVNIEKGRQRPPLHTLWEIAEALDADPKILMPSREEVKTPEGIDPELRRRVAEEMNSEDSETVRRIAEFIQTSGTDS